MSFHFKILKKPVTAVNQLRNDFVIKSYFSVHVWVLKLFFYLSEIKNIIELLLYESSKFVAKLEVDLNNEIRELFPDSYEDKRLEMERKEEIYIKNLEKRRSKKREKLTESNSIFSKEIQDVKLNKSKNLIHNNTSI